MQPRATTVERHPHFAAWQAGQFIDRGNLGCADVGRGQDPDANRRPSVCTNGADASEHITQLPQPGNRDEADQDIDLLGSPQFAPEFAQKRWRSLSGGEQPRSSQSGLWRLMVKSVSQHGGQDGGRIGHQLQRRPRLR
jgi:hypothetical protein